MTNDIPGNSASRDKLNIKLFLTLLITAVISRIYGVWEWELAGDEHFTVFHAHERYASIVNPAYYVLVVATKFLFGESVWLSRLPALILGILSIPVLYLTWSKVIGKNAALYAALIVVFSAWHLWFSQFARFYIGVFFFSSLAHYYFIKALTDDKYKFLFLAILNSLFAILFHVTAIFVPVSAFVAYLLLFLFKQSPPRFSRRILRFYLTLSVIGALVVLPFLLDVLMGWSQSGQQWGRGYLTIIPQLVKYAQLPIVIPAIFGWLYLLKNDSVKAVYFASGIGIPILFLACASPFIAVRPDYVFYILPLLTILAGLIVEVVRDAFKNSGAVSYVLLAFILVSLIPSFVSHYMAKKSLHMEEAVSFIEKNYKSGDNVMSFLSGFKLHARKDFNYLPYPGHDKDGSIDWHSKLNGLLTSENKTWILLSIKRRPLGSRFENWLLCNSQLVWRKTAKRIDFEVDGLQVFVVTPNKGSSHYINENCR